MPRLKTPLAALAIATVTASLFTGTAAHAASDADLVLSYSFTSGSGTTVSDLSGNGRDATIVGGATRSATDGLRLDGADDAVDLPDNVLTGLDSITVSTEALVRQDQGGSYMIYALGNTTNGVGNGYLFSGGNTYRTSIATGNWSTEQTANSGQNLTRDRWATLTYTLDGASDIARVYLDGKQVGERTGTTISPKDIGGGSTTSNWIGKSVYNADPNLAGSVRDFRIWKTALSAAEVAALVPSDQTRAQRDADSLSLGDTSNVTTHLALPTTGANGSTIAWASSDAAVVSTQGKVTRPANQAATVTLTATLTKGAANATKTFSVTVPAAPTAQQSADEAVAAVSVVDAGDVRGNLTLASSSQGFDVTWKSSNAAIVATDGIVKRPASGDASVTLTATASKNGVSSSKDIALTVRKAVGTQTYEGYAFAYFTGNSIEGENIYFAASNGNNALSWKELNGGQPVLRSNQGTKGLRDPFVIRSPEGDKFYMIATDLSIGSGTSWGDSQRTGSKYLEVWESRDLKNWSEQRHVRVSPDNAGNTWAPEAYYDESIGAYVVFWASKLYDASGADTYNRMLYATTRDFRTFSEAKVWQDDGRSRIDSTVIKESNTYYRFTKDEGASGTGCSDIIQEKSSDLKAPLSAWTITDTCIGRDAGTGAVEGPTVFKANPGDVNGQKYYLFVDEYGGRGYIPLATADLEKPDWNVPATYRLPASPRHGTVIPVTAAELEGLSPAVAPISANEKGEIVKYDFRQGSGTTVVDASGNGRNATAVGGATWTGDSISLDGSDDYIDFPDNLLTGVTDLSITADVKIRQAQDGAYFIYGLGNTDGAGVGNGYLFTSGNNYRSSITTGNWTGEQTVSGNSALPRDTWVNLTYTLKDTTATIYLDGVQVAQNTGVTTDPKDIGGGTTLANYLGRSMYNADRRLSGEFRSFTLYNKALTSAEVLTQSGNTTALGSPTLADPAALHTTPLVDTSKRTVLFPVKRGTDVTKLAPTFELAGGSTASPASGTVVDLSKPVTYTVTGSNGATATWTISASEVKSPVLPGLYADPNIAVFGGTYYIYATTDGTPGWGGNTFYSWRSTNLVDWTRSEKPFLTLDGANGNVPWATGNAWAPTIIEKGGKYYFYFSGHNAQLNTKTIGVAVADSPEGPFTAQPQAMITNSESVNSGQAIDPATFQDPKTGRFYLFWGNGAPVYGELSDDMLSIKSGSIKRISGLNDFREGLFMNYRDGRYHLTYAIDDTGSENYRVGYATSTSVDGPWTYRGVILQKNLELGIKGPAHSSIINVPGTDEWYIAYHRFAIPNGNGTNRETTIDRVPITADGYFGTITPTLTSVAPREVPNPTPLSVTVSGDAKVGSDLTAVVKDGWNIASVRWKRDGQDIGGATSATYRVTSADAGKALSVVVSGTKALWPNATATSKSTTVEAPVSVTLSAAPRCVAGKVVLSTQATNTSSSALDLTITTPYGTKTFPGVASGKSVSTANSTRLTSIEAGTVSVKLGTAAPAAATATYKALSCG